MMPSTSLAALDPMFVANPWAVPYSGVTAGPRYGAPANATLSPMVDSCDPAAHGLTLMEGPTSGSRASTTLIASPSPSTSALYAVAVAACASPRETYTVPSAPTAMTRTYRNRCLRLDAALPLALF